MSTATPDFTERLERVETFRVRLFCPCGGEMQPTNVILTCIPVKYIHVCDKCNRKHTSFDRYPCIRYETASGAPVNQEAKKP